MDIDEDLMQQQQVDAFEREWLANNEIETSQEAPVAAVDIDPNRYDYASSGELAAATDDQIRQYAIKLTDATMSALNRYEWRDDERSNTPRHINALEDIDNYGFNSRDKAIEIIADTEKEFSEEVKKQRDKKLVASNGGLENSSREEIFGYAHNLQFRATLELDAQYKPRDEYKQNVLATEALTAELVAGREKFSRQDMIEKIKSVEQFLDKNDPLQAQLRERAVTDERYPLRDATREALVRQRHEAMYERTRSEGLGKSESVSFTALEKLAIAASQTDSHDRFYEMMKPIREGENLGFRRSVDQMPEAARLAFEKNEERFQTIETLREAKAQGTITDLERLAVVASITESGERFEQMMKSINDASGFRRSAGEMPEFARAAFEKNEERLRGIEARREEKQNAASSQRQHSSASAETAGVEKVSDTSSLTGHERLAVYAAGVESKAGFEMLMGVIREESETKRRSEKDTPEVARAAFNDIEKRATEIEAQRALEGQIAQTRAHVVQHVQAGEQEFSPANWRSRLQEKDSAAERGVSDEVRTYAQETRRSISELQQASSSQQKEKSIEQQLG